MRENIAKGLVPPTVQETGGRNHLNIGLLGIVSLVLPLWASMTGCCTGGTLQVRTTGARVVEWKATYLIVELITDLDVVPLEKSKWAVNVQLIYCVDDNQPVRIAPDSKDYDLASITYTRPFSAILVDSVPIREGEFRSRWRINLTDRIDVSPVIYEYSLTDGKDHVMRLEVYGASYIGGFLRSNPVTIQVSAPDKKER